MVFILVCMLFVSTKSSMLCVGQTDVSEQKEVHVSCRMQNNIEN